jgi:predicted dehydrogenase
MADSKQTPLVSRREFLKTSAAAGVTAALLASGNYAFAQGSDRIRVGLIGCGGRGSGAAINAVSAAPGVELYALGDMFKFQVDGAKQNLGREIRERMNKPDAFNVSDDRCFWGLDAYKKVIASGANYIILATPPGYRPIHFEAAVAAGKNVFMEKPVATDGPGLRKMLAAAEASVQKGLAVVAGTQRRHQASYIETIKRIKDGAIGDIVGGQCYWNGGGIWFRDRDPNMTDLEYQSWNWYHYVWACGDHIVEQHVHNLDVMNWVMGAHPVACIAVGGRTQRVDPRTQIWDHFAVDLEYPGGVRILSMCRHWSGCVDNVSERVVGTKGVSNPGGSIDGPNQWRYSGGGRDPYTQEHTDLIESIRANKPLNEAKQVTESTAVAIMGRMAAYTGQLVRWEQVINSQENLVPDMSKPDASIPMGPIAVPGKTKLV